MLEKWFEKEKTCRACTKTNIELSSLFAKRDAVSGLCFSDMITECTMYKVQEDDELPHLICSECKYKVGIAYEFKKQCEESHRKLLSVIEAMKEAQIESDNKCNNLSEKDKDKEILEGDNNKLRKRSTRNTPSRNHPCEKCDQTFAKYDQLMEHIQKEHATPHICSLCSKGFIRLGHLSRHLHRVHKIASEEIPTKEVLIKTESELVIPDEIPMEISTKAETDTEDLNFDNDEDPIYQADLEYLKSVKDELELVDGKIYTKELSAIDEKKGEHEENEEEKSGSIIKEGDEQRPKTKIKSTIKMFYDDNRMFQCDQCHKAFKRKSHLKQHLLCHTKVKPYQCTICEKRFGRPDNLKVHMGNHGQKQFQCNVCDRSFGQPYLLKRHKDQTHSEEKPFLCSECGQRFVRNGDLAVHMRRHTGEKPYKCQYCNKGFTRSTEVYVHERYHTGEKNHVCNICGKAFQRPYNLLVHIRTHTGERPYQCPHCPKNFAQCSDLKAHIRRHTGERYRCDQCGMGFIHVFVLNQHKLSVHGVEVQSRIKRVTKLSTDTQ